MDTVQNKWLGPIISSWRRPRIGALGINVNTKNTDMKESNLLTLSYGRIKRKNIQTSEGLLPASFETYQIVEAGDIIFRFTDLQNDKRSLRSALVEERGIITSAYVNFRPNHDQVNSVYFAYLMRALDLRKAFYEMGSGVRQTLKFEELASVPIPLPPLDTQRVIADYLDRETSEIDAMLDKLEGLAQLLANRRRNEINSAFTAPKLAPLWNFCDINPQTTDFKSLAENTLVTFMPLETIWSDHRVDFSRTIKWSKKVGSYTEFQKEDVLIPKITPTFEAGRAMVANIPLPIGLATTEVHIARAKTKKALPEWLSYAFQTTSFLKEGEATLQGVGNLRRITPQWLQQFKVPDFSLTEQAQIVAQLDETTAKIDTMLAKVQELKDLLIERRSALITAAVTGRIEVN